MTHDLQTKLDLTPEKISHAIFNNNADPFGVMGDLKKLAGIDDGSAIIELGSTFSLEVSRGKYSTEVGREKFEEALTERAQELNLKI